MKKDKRNRVTVRVRKAREESQTKQESSTKPTDEPSTYVSTKKG